MKAGEFKKSDVTVVYIAGYGRSGSTLLEILLSNVDGVRGLGEVVNYYGMCGDSEHGSLLQEGFWGEVKEKVIACLCSRGSEGEVLSKANHAIRRCERFRSWWRLFMPSQQDVFKDYRNAVDCLFGSIFSSGKGEKIFVDSSKTAWLSSWRPFCLYRAGYRVKMIHIVRDGRSVIGSVLKGDNVKMQHGLDDVSFRAPVSRSIFGWVFANMSAFINSKLSPGDCSYLLRYEDLINNTQQVLVELGEYIDIDLSRVASRLAENEPLDVKGCGFSGNRILNNNSITVNADLARPAPLQPLYLLYYWIVAGWLHRLIYCRDGK